MITAVVPALGFHAEMVPFRLAKMKRADVPFTRKDEVSVLATLPVGPWGPLAVFGIVTVRAALVTSLLPVTASESGCIGTLVRNPKGACVRVGNTPRVHQV